MYCMAGKSTQVTCLWIPIFGFSHTIIIFVNCSVPDFQFVLQLVLQLELKNKSSMDECGTMVLLGMSIGLWVGWGIEHLMVLKI